MALADRFRWTRTRRDAAVAGGMALAIALGWGLACGFFAGRGLEDPISYRGDADLTAAAVAAARRGEWAPFGSKLVPSLGAPSVASWNDFPSTDDVIIWGVGLLARLTGTIAAINLGFLLACVSAGLALFFAARRLGFTRDGAALGGFLYGLTPFLFFRNVHHFTLTFIGVLPLDVLVMAYLASRRGLPLRSRRFAVAAATAVLTGWSFSYYIFFGAQLFTLGALAGLMRNGRRLRWGPVVALAAILMASTLSVSLDSLAWARERGVNATAIRRQPNEVEVYALKPLNLFVGSPLHRLPFMRAAAAKAGQTLIPGEAPAPYLGLVGGALLIALALAGLASIARGERPGWKLGFAATAAWFILADDVGGLSSLLGLFKLVLFRSLNRASVVVAALALLFGAWALPRALRRLPRPGRWAVLGALAGVGLLDAVSLPDPRDPLPAIRAQARSDQHLVEALEAALPEGAMVFQLPPMDFPETPPQFALDSYELLRPSFYSHTLRFSHGDVKGRPSAQWKFRVAEQAPAQLRAALKEAGFAIILLNRRGYPDGGAGLIEGLLGAGCRELLRSEVGESVALAL